MAQKPERVFQGTGVSAGVVLGTALKLESHKQLVLKVHTLGHMVEEEVQRFLRAVDLSKTQLEVLKRRLEDKVGREHSYILDAHILMLEDKGLLSEIISSMRTAHVSAEWAVCRATDRLRQACESLNDEYFRERGRDIENIVERLLMNLSGEAHEGWAPLPEDLILVARDFDPSNFALVELEKVRGLALESGSRTAHTAIIARSLRLAAVFEVRDFLSSVTTGDTVLVDGDRGQVTVNPEPNRLAEARQRLEAFQAVLRQSSTLPRSPAVTLDGVVVSVQANTELLHEVRAAKSCGAEGIGLFRSEFLFFAHPRGFPSMSDQLETYEMLGAEMHPYPVAIRTLDVGGDKIPAGLDLPQQPNPSMGLRGIRLSLKSPELFATQIEAILRASLRGRMEIVLPMISTVEEIWQAKEVIQQVRERLLRASVPLTAEVPVGAMIEVPSAVLILELISREVDFLCVGTNDLVQYTLAVDRSNPQVSHLFQPLHPSILHCLRRIAEVSRPLGKSVRICGEIAANPFFAVLLVGLGYSRLSMNAYAIPTIREFIASISFSSARELAEKAMSLRTAGEVRDFLTEALPKLVKTDLTPYLKEIRSPDDRTSLTYVS
jgi:phosphoenolpyruvate-protein phosphotransferase (PTS system enzyme I)